MSRVVVCVARISLLTLVLSLLLAIRSFIPRSTTGFTAWSSKREPCQVFRLLETLYGEFDILAKNRRVFKVETVGTLRMMPLVHAPWQA
jgi:Adenylate and Guanylate cyclase catalytic domain